MLVAALGLLLVGVPLSDSVAADLNSPVYAVREKAQDSIRAAYVPTDRKRWDALSADLQREIGHSRGEVFFVCAHDGASFPNFVENLPPDLADFHFRARLDSSWMLECNFRDQQLHDAKLVLRPVAMKASPPDGYTGLWRTYRENGDLASQVYYSKGRALGPLVDSPVYSAQAHPPPPTPDLGVIEYDPAQ